MVGLRMAGPCLVRAAFDGAALRLTRIAASIATTIATSRMVGGFEDLETVCDRSLERHHVGALDLYSAYFEARDNADHAGSCFA